MPKRKPVKPYRPNHVVLPQSFRRALLSEEVENTLLHRRLTNVIMWAEVAYMYSERPPKHWTVARDATLPSPAVMARMQAKYDEHNHAGDTPPWEEVVSAKLALIPGTVEWHAARERSEE